MSGFSIPIKALIKGIYWGLFRLVPIRYLRTAAFRRGKILGNGKIRGTSIVRQYWHDYLQAHHADIHGRALEIGSVETLQKFKGVSCAEAIDISAQAGDVDLVADLSRADAVSSDRYDCFINQFSMHVIYDVEAALYHSVRILKPGGVLLVNFSSVDYYFPDGMDMGTGAPLFLYHCFTPIGVENFLRRIGLSAADYQLEVYGSLFSRLAYEMNMPAEELTREELELRDPHYPVLICVRVVKPQGWNPSVPEYRDAWHPDVQAPVWSPVTGERV